MVQSYKFQILGFLFVCFQQFWSIFNDEKLLFIVLQRGCSSDIASSHFSVQVKSRSMLHHGSVGVSSEQNKRNLTLTYHYYLLLFFYDKICLYHDFYGFTSFTAYSQLIYYMRRYCHYMQKSYFENFGKVTQQHQW